MNEMDDLRTAAVVQFLQDFCTRSGLETDQRWDVYGFGDSPEMADELGDLVVNGPKRATAGLRSDFAPTGDDLLPEVGVYSVIVGGHGQPMNQVDAAFAWDEGEGDRSLQDWMDGHRRYFTRYLASQGITFADDMLVVLERFALLWPTSTNTAPIGPDAL